MGILVTAGVVVAAIAFGELCLSSPASRYPVAAAESLFDEVLQRFAERERREELEGYARMFEIERVQKGLSNNPQSYLTNLDPHSFDAVQKDLQAAKKAAAAGEGYEFRRIETRVYLHLVSKDRRKKS